MAAATTSCSVRRTEGDVDDAVLETVARIGRHLPCEAGGEAAAVVESLRELQRVHMTVEVLEATRIGRAVNALRKNAPSEQARQLAATLYTGWKAVVDERLRSSRTPPPPPRAGKGIENRSCPSSLLPVEAKQSARPDGDRDEMAPTSVVVEAAPETKLRRHGGLDGAAIVTKPTSLRVVVNANAPGKAEQPLRRVTVVVRRTAERPVDPAPASNTATRNGGIPNSNQQAKCSAMASHLCTNAAAKRVWPAGAATSTTAKPPTATALPKPVVGSSGACKRKAEDPAVYDEARLARARARLQERYNEIEAAKEKRKIKEIKAIDALGKMGRQRPAGRVVVRCMAAQRTGKQAPVACPRRMPRAF